MHPASFCCAGKAIAPIYEELSQKYPQVKFLKIDIDNQDMQSVVNDHCITGVVSPKHQRLSMFPKDAEVWLTC